MKRTLSAFAIVGIFVYAQFVHAAMTSTNYQIRWDTLSTGGSDTASSATYLLQDSVSGTESNAASSDSYQIADGYRAGIIPRVMTFDLYIQNSTNEVAATGLADTTISVASTTPFSVGNRVALVQDRGANQVVAFGKVARVGPGEIQLDYLTVDDTSPVIDGSEDYVYLLNSPSLTLESLSISSVATGVVGFEVTVDNENGYVIQIFEDTDLTSGADTIDDVADGTVSAGREEFGAHSSDGTLASTTFDTADAAITSSAQDVVTRSTYAIDDRSFLVFKLGGSTATASGTYTNIISFIASGNF